VSSLSQSLAKNITSFTNKAAPQKLAAPTPLPEKTAKKSIHSSEPAVVFGKSVSNAAFSFGGETSSDGSFKFDPSAGGVTKPPDAKKTESSEPAVVFGKIVSSAAFSFGGDTSSDGSFKFDPSAGGVTKSLDTKPVTEAVSRSPTFMGGPKLALSPPRANFMTFGNTLVGSNGIVDLSGKTSNQVKQRIASKSIVGKSSLLQHSSNLVPEIGSDSESGADE